MSLWRGFFLWLLVAAPGYAVTAGPTPEPASASPLAPVAPVPLPPGVALWVSPLDHIEDELIKVIDSAKVEILCSQYVITSPRIVRALLEAFRTRHVFIGIILESRPNLRDYQTPAYLRSNGIPVLLRAGPRGINNHKFWVIDRAFVLTGSYDCTMIAASANDENLLKIQDVGLAVAYLNAWIEQSSRCTPVP